VRPHHFLLIKAQTSGTAHRSSVLSLVATEAAHLIRDDLRRGVLQNTDDGNVPFYRKSLETKKADVREA
jgi:hypothetical protein